MLCGVPSIDIGRAEVQKCIRASLHMSNQNCNHLVSFNVSSCSINIANIIYIIYTIHFQFAKRNEVLLRLFTST